MTNYIDPGTTKGCAVASFQGPGLLGLGFWFQEHGMKEQWGLITQGPSVWELPQLYPNEARSKPALLIARGNDLIKLAAAGSACANVLSWGRGGVTCKTAGAWKGQVPKPVMHMRAFEVLNVQELALLGRAYCDTSRIGARDPVDMLVSYVQGAVRQIGLRQKPSYQARITDLLDAVCFGLKETGRLR